MLAAWTVPVVEIDVYKSTRVLIYGCVLPATQKIEISTAKNVDKQLM